MVGPKLSLKVVSAKLSLSQNFARHSKFRVCARKLRRLPIIVLELLRAAGKGEWMPKVSNQVQRRIAELDAKYTSQSAQAGVWSRLSSSQSLPSRHSLTPIALRPTLSNSP